MRKAEDELANMYRDRGEEDTRLCRELHRIQSKHADMLRTAEEAGYERCLRDAMARANTQEEEQNMKNVLDVRGVAGNPARIREIRAMAGRAMLDGPHGYRTEELEGPLLDLAVANAVGLSAVIRKVDNAIEPFFEC